MPRRPPPKCPPELLALIDEINKVPRAGTAEWKAFRDAMKEIIGPIETVTNRLRRNGWEDADLRRFNDCSDAIEVEEVLRKEFREGVETASFPETQTELASFREFALWLDDYMDSWADFYRSTIEARSRVLELQEMIRTLASGEDFTYTAQGLRFLRFDENAVPFELDRNFGDAVSYIVDNKIRMDRMSICCICDRVFWQNYGGKRRRPETCGQKSCYTKLGNLRKKWRQA